MRISVIIPAHNEEEYIGNCLDSINKAKETFSEEVEVIVVLNRCTDKTEQIALSKNAKVIIEDSKNLSKIRNAGVRASTGEIIATIDADSEMSSNVFFEIDKALTSGKYIGGGIKIKPERYSLGIFLTYTFVDVAFFLTRMSAGLFWLRRKDFEIVGGFNENLSVAEDLDFVKRLKIQGKKRGFKYGRLPNSHIITSCRKFDKFGDWHAIKIMLFESKKLRDAYNNKNSEYADAYFYDFNSKK